jgi:hypothetical protein
VGLKKLQSLSNSPVGVQGGFGVVAVFSQRKMALLEISHFTVIGELL